MSSVKNRVIAWVYIYWVSLTMLLNATMVVFLTNTYSYSSVFSDALLGAIFATAQLAFHKLGGRREMPFYAQYLTAFVCFLVFWSIVFSTSGDFLSSIEIIFLLSLVSSIPVSCIAYFVKVRLLKYDTKS
ncbi:hypothetical protein [Glaciecola sp. SC05]|uniref:hypothetical protein n=1 Tax=Glaciecola sp. SC05 TaxID=1987355 RepID=UPI003528617D